MEQDWEWFEPLNPDRLFIVKTKDVRIYQLNKKFTISDVEAWLDNDNNSYNERCLKRSSEQKYFTFKGFDDMIDFVKINRYIPGYIRVTIEKDGDMTVAHGQHRWAAAYLCGIKEIQAKLCRRI